MPYTWNSSKPFYQGRKWEDYITKRGIETSFDENNVYVNRWGVLRAWVQLVSPPNGTMIFYQVSGVSSFEDDVTELFGSGDNKILSQIDIPSGYWKKGTMFSVVSRNTREKTLTKRMFEFISVQDALDRIDGTLSVAIVEKINEIVAKYFRLMSLGFIELTNSEESGVWVPTGSEVTTTDSNINNNANWLSDLIEESQTGDNMPETTTSAGAHTFTPQWIEYQRQLRMQTMYKFGGIGLGLYGLLRKKPIATIAGVALAYLGNQPLDKPNNTEITIRDRDVVTDSNTGLQYSAVNTGNPYQRLPFGRGN